MTNGEDRPIGQRFSHVYIERGEPIDDSRRMRRRIAAIFGDVQNKSHVNLGASLERELGIDTPRHQMTGEVIGREFFRDAALKDVLDAISIIRRALSGSIHMAYWHAQVSRILQEENTCYRLDEEGGVHYAPDEEYERNRVSAIKALEPARYGAALAEFESAQAAVSEQPPNGKGGIQRTFEAVEIVFKLMCPGAIRLSGQLIDQHLTPIIEAEYDEQKTAKEAALKIRDSFKDWVNSAHYYRHGQADEEPRQPPLALAILLMSSGAGFLRWLAELDQSQNG